MTTALKAINGGSKQRSDVQGQAASRLRKQTDAEKSIRPHCKVSIEDINWVRQQPPSVQQLESASELGELPTAMDCTSLALVDAAPSQPVPLLAEKQDYGVEAIFPHEGTCSAAPVAQNEFSSKEAIAHQKIEPSHPSASLLAEKQDCGVEPTISHEEPSSAAPVSLNQSEIFEWLDRANVGECPPLWVIQYLLDSKYYASMRATISKFEKQWNLSVVNYQVQKSSEALFTAVRGASRREDIAITLDPKLDYCEWRN
ncbi:MAG: hypothetical protein V7K71_15950 [Nostoc sp.]|uniref:hypothetical protein n=1 Tax=Nostoc sp. TaxID=1180 RepID=UPI002FF631E0